MVSHAPFVIGGIYWYVNPQISSTDPHPHVCVGEYEGNWILLFCGTSNFTGKKRHFVLNKIATETLVRIQPNQTNTLTVDTYLNCNEVQYHSISDLTADKTFKLKGNISDSEMWNLKNAIAISELLEQDIQQYILSILPDV